MKKLDNAVLAKELKYIVQSSVVQYCGEKNTNIVVKLMIMG